MSTGFDISKALEAKSDQLNAIDYASGPGIVTITEARPGDADQQVWLGVAEHPGKHFKPSKTALRVIAKGWGKDASQYVGRRLELYNDPEVRWAGEKVGGIRVSAMSHIDKPFTMTLPVSRGKTQKVTIQPLQVQPPTDWQALIAQAGNDRDALLQLHGQATQQNAPQDIVQAIIAAGQQAAQPEQEQGEPA